MRAAECGKIDPTIGQGEVQAVGSLTFQSARDYQGKEGRISDPRLRGGLDLP